MTEPKDFIGRVGAVAPTKRPKGQALHRPLLLLWALSQAAQQRPRQQPWSVTRAALEPVLTAYSGASHDGQAAVYPFWALQKDELWEVAGAEELALTSSGRRPPRTGLDMADPLAGLRKDDYDLITEKPEIAAWAAGTLLVKFFNPLPAGLLEALDLASLLGGRIDTSLSPHVGERFSRRGEIAGTYGGNGVGGITPLADGILSVYSDDKGPYDDKRIPETDWIAYTGDGLSGDQRIKAGNSSMAKYQEQRRALRYWHKPHGGTWSFETWAVIVGCRRRWGIGEDGKRRREFVWTLAPVSSPFPDNWPADIIKALDEDDHRVVDDTDIQGLGDQEPDTTAASGRGLSDHERYQRLTAAAGKTAARRTARSKRVQAERYFRSQSAREAVILRSGGRCENPSCLGHPLERTDAGAPILEVDHVNDLGRGGLDLPETMVALCPNCHALKTHGQNRHTLRKKLLGIAHDRHQQLMQQQ